MAAASQNLRVSCLKIEPWSRFSLVTVATLATVTLTTIGSLLCIFLTKLIFQTKEISEGISFFISLLYGIL